MSVKSDRLYESQHPELMHERDQSILKQYLSGVPENQIYVNQITSSQLTDSALIHQVVTKHIKGLEDQIAEFIHGENNGEEYPPKPE